MVCKMLLHLSSYLTFKTYHKVYRGSIPFAESRPSTLVCFYQPLSEPQAHPSILLGWEPEKTLPCQLLPPEGESRAGGRRNLLFVCFLSLHSSSTPSAAAQSCQLISIGTSIVCPLRNTSPRWLAPSSQRSGTSSAGPSPLILTTSNANNPKLSL